ncbi:peroxisomal biogenesis factor 3 [Nannochloropsis oceanica]
MESLSKAYHFLRRNRRAIGLVAGVSAAGLAMWRVKRVLDEYKRLIKEHDVARLDQHRLQMHMLRSRGECVPALLNFMQTLRKRVNEIVDVTSPVKALKAGRGELSKEQEQALWQQVKVSGFTRFFLAYYGFTLLNVMLRVQVHILGRYAFETSRREIDGAQQQQQQQQHTCSLNDEQVYAAAGAPTFGADDRCKLLSLVYEFFLGEGLRRLKESVEIVISEELGGWSVHDKVHVGYEELHDAFSRIRRRMEGPRGVTTAELPLLQYIVDMSSITEDELGGGGNILHEMVNETWDALESPSFKLAVEDCLDATFRVFLEDLFVCLYASRPAPASLASKTIGRMRNVEEEEDAKGRMGEGKERGGFLQEPQETGQDSSPESNPGQGGKASDKDPPLAKLIPHMKNAATKVFNNDPQSNEYIRVTAQNRSVNLLCSSFFTTEISFV